MQQYGINDFFTDSFFGEAAQLLKDGASAPLLTVEISPVDLCFQQLCRVLIRISYVLAYFFACDFLF